MFYIVQKVDYTSQRRVEEEFVRVGDDGGVFAAGDAGYSRWGPDIDQGFRTCRPMGPGRWGFCLRDYRHRIEVIAVKDTRSKPDHLASARAVLAEHADLIDDLRESIDGITHMNTSASPKRLRVLLALVDALQEIDS